MDPTSNRISILGEIGGDPWFPTTGEYPYEAFLEDMKTLDGASEIEVVIDSPGGDLFVGRSIYTALKESGAKINVRLLSHASSAASLIACAGDHVSALSCTLSLIHRCSCYFGDRYNVNDLKETISAMETFDRNAAEIYAKRSDGKSADDFLEVMDQSKYWTAQELLDMGLVDEIRDEGGEEESAQIQAEFKKRNELFMSENETVKALESEKAKNQEILANVQALETKMAELSKENEELAAKNDELAKALAEKESEMERIREIDENAALFSDPNTVLKAKYESKLTMSELAVQELKIQAQEKKAFANARESELNMSGVNGVLADGNTEPAMNEEKESNEKKAKRLLETAVLSIKK